jgi:predicted ArsR family transcriptional regulator
VDWKVESLAALSSLNDPLRRRVYDCVGTDARGASRDTVAQALGLPRSVAAFHLDKLVVAGLLTFEFRRPPGRSGPGAGRPAKWYRHSDVDVAVSIPDRRYDLAAQILATAVERSADGVVASAEALRGAAREHGRSIGDALLRPGGGRPGRLAGTLEERLVDVLAEHGYAPRVTDGRVTLANCPFKVLAAQHQELVCRMNHELLSGVVEEAGLPGCNAVLDPAPGRCCVTLVA